MQTTPVALDPGLYFLATPIGAARDITLRALDILASADVLAAEDTRTLKHLCQIHGIALGDRQVLSYHEHSPPGQRQKLMDYLAAGKSVAYASEAGTPLVADPGYQLGRSAIENDVRIYAAPGPSAVLAALTVSGLPTDRFFFAGFLPSAKGARQKVMAELRDVPATLVFYESPKRLQKMLTELAQSFGETRHAVVCRELTKRFEETVRGTLADLAAEFTERNAKGEIVVLVERAKAVVADDESIGMALRTALQNASVKDAAAQVAAALNLPKRQVYQLALSLDKAE